MILIAPLLLILSSGAENSSDGLRQAVGQVQRETNGKILSARTVTVGNDQLYRIKVLTDEGKVQTRTIRSVVQTSDPVSAAGRKVKPKPPDETGRPDPPERSDSKE